MRLRDNIHIQFEDFALVHSECECFFGIVSMLNGYAKLELRLQARDRQVPNLDEPASN